MTPPEIPFRQLFVLLFMMTGPLRVVPSFAAMARNLPAADRSEAAFRAVRISIAAVVLAIFLGRLIMKSWGASPQAVAAASGLLLALASLQGILGKPDPSEPATEADGIAMSPLAFPTMVPPFAVGVLILFASFAQGNGQLVSMAGLAVGMLLLDWLGMRHADRILAVLRPPVLRVLGSVFGVLQLSLGLEMIRFALRD